MKKRTLKQAFAVLAGMAFALFVFMVTPSCQSCTRTFGGTTNIELKDGEKFINVTWKNDNIWVLTQKANSPKTYTFTEYSNMGVLEGEVIITEK
jgi:hypothetical protein